MIRKIITWIGITCLTFTLTACGGEDKADVVDFADIKPKEPDAVIIREERSEEATTTEEMSEEESTVEEEIIPFCDRTSVVYQVTEETFEQGNIKITYPQIAGMENVELMELMNEHIAEQMIPEEVLTDERCEAYEVTYEIATQGTGVLSVVFRGYEFYTGAAHPNLFCKTMNLNMENGENIRLKDYAPVENIVTGLEIASGYTMLSDISLEDFSAFMNNGYVTDYAITLLDYDLDFSSELVVSGYSYIKDNHPVLCIETEHAMGDYVEIMFDMPIE